jgi:hypothetical protein
VNDAYDLLLREQALRREHAMTTTPHDAAPAERAFPRVVLELPDGDEREAKVRWTRWEGEDLHVCISVGTPSRSLSSSEEPKATKAAGTEAVQAGESDFQTRVALLVGADESDQADILRHIEAWKAASPPSLAVAQEAVAWQARLVGAETSNWFDISDADISREYFTKRPQYEVRPLYAAPAHPEAAKGGANAPVEDDAALQAKADAAYVDFMSGR